MSSRIIRATLEQFEALPSPTDSWEKALSKIEKTSASLQIFPELFNSGYAYEQFEDIAQINGSQIEAVIERSHDLGQMIVLGCLVHSGDPQRRYVNRLYCIFQGSVSQYDKNHLIPAYQEPRYFQRGKKSLILPLPYTSNVKIGCSICYDLRFPELFREYAREKADVLLNIARWPAARIEDYEILARARAMENQAWFIGVNAVDKQCPGGSIVVSPKGQVVLRGDGKEQALDAIIDLEELAKCRREFPVLEEYLATI